MSTPNTPRSRKPLGSASPPWLWSTRIVIQTTSTSSSPATTTPFGRRQWWPGRWQKHAARAEGWIASRPNPSSLPTRLPMADVAAKEVQKLRQMAGVGMMDAKRALVETAGDIEKAMELLRVRGLAKVAKRAGEREANQGSIGYYLHYQADRPVIGVLVDLACETDFVAKNPEFRKVADEIAMHIAWGKPRWIRREDVDEAELERERQFFAAQA